MSYRALACVCCGCLAGSAEDNAARIDWLLDNGVFPVIYPLPRHGRMVEDHLAVIRMAADWAWRTEQEQPGGDRATGSAPPGLRPDSPTEWGRDAIHESQVAAQD